VVEGGRRLVVVLRVTGREPASLAGRGIEAWRLEARIESPSERRPISATLLITQDARRLPVEMRIETGFGSFRAELVEYTSR
jgi:hypothetical protein